MNYVIKPNCIRYQLDSSEANVIDKHMSYVPSSIFPRAKIGQLYFFML